MTKRYDPSPTQLELFQPAPVDFAKLAATPLKTVCNFPKFRLSADQYKCRTCGVVWDLDEERPISPSCLPYP